MRLFPETYFSLSLFLSLSLSYPFSINQSPDNKDNKDSNKKKGESGPRENAKEGGEVKRHCLRLNLNKV